MIEVGLGPPHALTCTREQIPHGTRFEFGDVANIAISRFLRTMEYTALCYRTSHRVALVDNTSEKVHCATQRRVTGTV